jgi:hypothetical protein
MSDLMGTLISALGPEVSQQVQSQFKLPAETSEQVLPAITDLLQSGLQEKAESGDVSDLLGGLAGMLGGNQDTGSGSGAEDLLGGLANMLGGGHSSGGGVGDIIGALFGSNISGMADGLAAKLGIDSNVAHGILQMVVPMVMSYFGKESGSGSTGGLGDLFSGDKTDDKGEEVAFTGDMKADFLDDLRTTYVHMKSVVSAVSDMGKALFEARERQKKRRLWTRFQAEIGMKTSTINNYIRVYERFGDRLPRYRHLGISKLELLASLKEPLQYLESNERWLEQATVHEIRKRIAGERKRSSKGKPKKRKDETVKVGRFTVTMSSNGRVLRIHGLNREIQKRLLASLKRFLSKQKQQISRHLEVSSSCACSPVLRLSHDTHFQLLLHLHPSAE